MAEPGVAHGVIDRSVFPKRVMKLQDTGLKKKRKKKRKDKKKCKDAARNSPSRKETSDLSGTGRYTNRG